MTSKYFSLRKNLTPFLWRLTQVLFKQGTTAIMFFIATYFLTKQDMGVYAYVSSMLLLLALFTDFGISTSTSRYVALYNSEDKEKVKRIFFNVSLVILVATVVVLVIFIFLKDILSVQYPDYLLLTLPMIFIYPMTSLMDGIYRGLKEFKKLALFTILNSVVGIGGAYLLVTNFGLNGTVVAPLLYFSSYLIILLIAYRGYQFVLDRKIVKDVTTYAMYFGIAALGHYLFSKMNVLILGSQNLLEEVAVYELLNKINTELLLPFIVLGQILAPNIVEDFSKKRFENIQKQFRKNLVLTLLAAIIFLPLSILITSVAVNLFFPIYSGEILQSLLLPVALTFSTAVPVVVINTGMITSTGHGKLMAIQNIITGIVNVLLNLFIIKSHGYIAVVWVTFAVQLISNTILYLIYSSKLKKLT
ncbi:MAG: oligosaccharide flippase family protein [Candidatus Dojkabacteria bacterium]|nr:oligosaccharide flippase family protein [Candidatus Dojkabacteria bacterium]MDD4561033.1 oligosaccharide flippase family protein [Candidatus Dojkabacteria bacterium]